MSREKKLDRVLIYFSTNDVEDTSEDTAVEVSIDIEEEVSGIDVVAFMIYDTSCSNMTTYISDEKLESSEAKTLLGELGRHTFTEFANLMYVSGMCDVVLDVSRNDKGLHVVAYRGREFGSMN